ncbi:MAG: UDP-2,4-diacetamido-2,4,6-trideoxy-beta-L-altropyranose hydrolase [Pseudomonadota bacterium]
MKVVFRTDGSTFMGQGHVMRCLTLANVLRERGAEINFICREHPGHLCDLVAQRGFVVHRLPLAEEGVNHLPGHAGWLGASWEADAEQTRHVIQGLGGAADVLVVDHYAVDHRWETALRPSASRILAIDDLADRVHDCDLLLDQNFFSDLSTRYDGKVPPGCVTLLGPDYALLQPVYAELHSQVELRDGPVRRIFVFFGGADTENLTGLSVAAFQEIDRSDIRMDVVMTEKNSRYQAIEKAIQGWSNIHLHGPLPSLGPLMATADLAIGAGGATVWERFCLGLPSVVISLAENQKPVCGDLARTGLIQYLGHKDQVTMEVLRNALRRVIGLLSIFEWSRNCYAICDGKGARRVAGSLFAGPTY